MRLTQLPSNPNGFPHPETAADEPNGLLAWGGDLHPDRLLQAYRHGIFPWYEAGDPILWWSPDPRCIIEPASYRPSRTLRKLWRKQAFEVSCNLAFEQVILSCQQVPRRGQLGTWITDEMRQAYVALHKRGHAHSIEVWHGEQLVGGLYGISTGQVFCGESMFSLMADASKYAFLALIHKLRLCNYRLLDCQMKNDYLEQLGAHEIPRHEFLSRLEQYHRQNSSLNTGPWKTNKSDWD